MQSSKKRKAPAAQPVVTSADAVHIKKSAKNHDLKDKENNASGRRARARDFDELVRQIIRVAAAEYRCCIATVSAFPDADEADNMAVQAWTKACMLKDSSVPVGAAHLKLVSEDISRLSYLIVMLSLDHQPRLADARRSQDEGSADCRGDVRSSSNQPQRRHRGGKTERPRYSYAE